MILANSFSVSPMTPSATLLCPITNGTVLVWGLHAALDPAVPHLSTLTEKWPASMEQAAQLRKGTLTFL